MSDHPVRFRIEPTMRFARIHVVIRLTLLLAIGTLGCSSVYWLLYVTLPPLVAIVVMRKGGVRYLAEDAPRILCALRWLAAAYAYLWLLTDELPTAEAGGAVALDVVPTGVPTASSSLLRLLVSLPALVLALVLSLASGLLWLIAAIVVLVKQRVPVAIADFLTLTLRYQVRLIAYHLSLVDRYPSVEVSSPVHATV